MRTVLLVYMKCGPKHLIGVHANSEPPQDVFWENLDDAGVDEQLERYIGNLVKYEMTRANLLLASCKE